MHARKSLSLTPEVGLKIITRRFLYRQSSDELKHHL